MKHVYALSGNVINPNLLTIDIDDWFQSIQLQDYTLKSICEKLKQEDCDAQLKIHTQLKTVDYTGKQRMELKN